MVGLEIEKKISQIIKLVTSLDRYKLKSLPRKLRGYFSLQTSDILNDGHSLPLTGHVWFSVYSKLPQLRPPKIKTISLFTTFLLKLDFSFLHFSSLSFCPIWDRLRNCPNLVLKATFRQPHRWSEWRNFTVFCRKLRNHM